MKHAVRLVTIVAVLPLLAACAAGSGESAHAASGGMVSEFVLGLWHGLIGPLTLLLELINSLLPHVLPWHAHLYEAKAAGAAYDLGFYIGFGGAPIIVWRRWRRR